MHDMMDGIWTGNNIGWMLCGQTKHKLDGMWTENTRLFIIGIPVP